MWINSNVQVARSRAQGLEAVRALGECQGADKHEYSPETTLPQWQGRRKQICVGTVALQQDRLLHPVGKQGFFLDCCLLALFQRGRHMDKCHLHGLTLVAPESRGKQKLSEEEFGDCH